MKINQYKYDSNFYTKLEKNKHGRNWPVVYILNSDREAYIGETSSFSRRLKEHSRIERRLTLTNINLIDDDQFNKSAVLDIESELIRLMNADGKFELQNLVVGQNQAHDYYDRNKYKKMIPLIWKNLKHCGLANKDYLTLTNSNLFIYSPYKTLTEDQYEASKGILYELGEALLKKQPCSIAVNGVAGTGKSILAAYLLKVLNDIKLKKYEKVDLDELEDDGKYEDGILEALMKAFVTSDYKIGMVVPVTSMRNTLKKAIGGVAGLRKNVIVTASDVYNEYKDGKKFDIIIIDEAQRLKQPINIQNLKAHYSKNDDLGLDKMATELDWIMKCSDYQIIFYDGDQRVNGSDVPIQKLKGIPYKSIYSLTTQMRVSGGEAYVEYIRSILGNNPPRRRIDIKDYEVKIFEDVNDMCNAIKLKNKEFDLCRNIAGYAWPWNTKYKKDKKTKADYDILIEGYKFRWNSDNNAWITQENSINEIGSIHTTQGQDLNYAGIIIGEDLTYDLESKRIIVHKKNLYDINAKRGLTDEEIRMNVLNAYYILLTRARRGVYLYICDEALRNYFKSFF
ncbi:MAG: DNA/RNA helicase domain-containing protein [Longicatena sp.]